MTVPLFIQGASAGAVKLPAEDARFGLGGLLTPRPATSTPLEPRPGVLPSVTMAAVTAATNGVLTVAPFSAVLPGRVAGQGSYVGTLRAAATLTPTLPAGGQFRAGVVYARVRDGIYDGGTNYDVEVGLTLGASASTSASVVVPSLPDGAIKLKDVVFSSTGIFSISYSPRRTVAVGGILPVDADELTVPGVWRGQYRDHPTAGLQRWTGAGWASASTALAAAKIANTVRTNQARSYDPDLYLAGLAAGTYVYQATLRVTTAGSTGSGGSPTMGWALVGTPALGSASALHIASGSNGATANLISETVGSASISNGQAVGALNFYSGTLTTTQDDAAVGIQWSMNDGSGTATGTMLAGSTLTLTKL